MVHVSLQFYLPMNFQMPRCLTINFLFSNKCQDLTEEQTIDSKAVGMKGISRICGRIVDR